MEKRTWSSNAGLPIGVRFEPTDQQLIVDYLLNKVNNNPLPYPTAIIDCDIYGEGIAWRRLFEESEEDSLYFFTRLKKKTEKGKRVDRVTDCGTWKGQQRDKDIFSRHGNRKVHIGSKRSFSFVPKKGFQENRCKWVMHEYRLDGCLRDENNFYVICRINNRKSKQIDATHDSDDHLDVDVNAAAICVPNNFVRGHHFDHVNHVFDNHMGGDGLNVSECMAVNGVGEYLNASNCIRGREGTREGFNGGDGSNTSNYMMGGDGLNVSNYMGGNGFGGYLNASNYMGGDDTGECLTVSNYCMGGDGTRECLSGFDGSNASTYMGGDGNGECLSISNSYMRGDALKFISDYLCGDDVGECTDVSDCIGGDGIEALLDVPAYMEEWFSLISNDNNSHPQSSDLVNPNGSEK